MSGEPGPRSTPKLAFGPFTYDQITGELHKHGIRIRLQGQPIQILTALLERPGEVVSREDFQRQLWSGSTFVDFEHGLTAAVNRLRQALGDSAEQPRYVETLAGKGYRFIAPLKVLPVEGMQAVPEVDVPVRGPERRGAGTAWLRACVAGALVIGLTGGYLAGRFNRDVVIAPPIAKVFAGTWELNPEKSQLDPNHRPRAATLSFEIDPQGHLLMKASGKDQHGKPVAERPLKLIIDGIERDVPEQPGLKVVYVQTGPRTIEVKVSRADGSVVGGASYAVSEAGTTLTSSTFGYDSQIREFKQQMVFERR